MDKKFRTVLGDSIHTTFFFYCYYSTSLFWSEIIEEEGASDRVDAFSIQVPYMLSMCVCVCALVKLKGLELRNHTFFASTFFLSFSLLKWGEEGSESRGGRLKKS